MSESQHKSVSKTQAVLLNFGESRKVTHASFESALRGSACLRRKQDGSCEWSPEARASGILVDISKAQWCDIGACARLLLVVERGLRDGLDVWFALPDPLARPNEVKWLNIWRSKSRLDQVARIEGNQRRRDAALRFLDNVGFTAALRCDHLPADAARMRLHLISDFGSRRAGVPGYALEESVGADDGQEGDSEGNEDSRATAPAFVYEVAEQEGRPAGERPRLHVTTFLRWVPVRENGESLGPILDGLEKEAAAVLAHRHRGLPEFDAEAFANVVFHELLENVAEHAGESVSHCLVTIWARSKGTYTIPGDYLTAEQPFFTEWASRNDLPLVEAVVGDSGVGLTACLRTAHDGVPEPREGVPDIFRDARGRTTRPTDEQSVLFWSMGRWTSRRPQDVSRGTRGLHRAHRLVQSYKGMITLRSGTTIAGWDHREGEEHPLADKGLGAAPGTVACVRFSLCERAARPVAKRTLGATDTCYFLAPSLDLSSGGISTPELEGIRLVYDLWIDPETGDDVSQCPWLEHVPGTDRYVCRIHDLKPDHCRKYPTSRRHADETGCPGFEGCRQGLYADETGGHIPVH